MLLMTVVTRIISGVHWFTDIIGAWAIGIALLAGYREAVETDRGDGKSVGT